MVIGIEGVIPNSKDMMTEMEMPILLWFLEDADYGV